MMISITSIIIRMAVVMVIRMMESSIRLEYFLQPILIKIAKFVGRIKRIEKNYSPIIACLLPRSLWTHMQNIP